NALDAIPDGKEVTVSCAEGDTGYIYAGTLPFERTTTDLGNMPPAPLKIMMNVANPDRAFDFGMLPNAGIGLARLEMIIASHIGVHPKALLEYDRQDAATRQKIDARIAGYAGPVEFYVDRLAEGIATITASVAPTPVIVRLSDLKSNEDANLLGASECEPAEGAPMNRLGGAEAGDRAPVGLQVQRVRQPHRRVEVRAARGEPDDRLPRRQPLRRSLVQGSLRAGVPGGQACARGDGPGQPVGDDPVRAH